MALIKPISGYPNSNTIDITNGCIFHTVIQGAGSIVNGYNCKIYDADTFEQVWESTKIAIEIPLTAGQTLEIQVPPGTPMQSDKSYYWTIRLYQKNTDMFVTSSSIQEGSTESDIKIRSQSNVRAEMELRIGENQRQITAYDVSTGIASLGYPFPNVPTTGTRCEVYSDYVDSIGFPFKTKQTPILTMTYSEKTGKSRTGQFYGSFGEDAVQVQWYRVMIYTINMELYHDSGKIFSSALSYEYTNFSNHETYYVQFVVQTIDNMTIESTLFELGIFYDTFTLDTDIGVVANGDSTITLDWKEDRLSDGVATGTYSFILMGINSVLGMTVDGVALPGRYYSWLDDIEGVPSVWNDDYYWTESLAYTEPAKRLQISTGTVYYNQANDEPLNMDFTNFTILSDVYVPINQTGTIISAINEFGETAYLRILDGNFVYTVNGVTKTTKTVDTSALSRHKIALTQDGATIVQADLE